jgi:Fe-S cluster biosynthesis and repair protein YggX
MGRMIECVKYKEQKEGLELPPYPGELGKRIYNEVSQQAWNEWTRQQTMLINEHRMNVMDPKARALLEKEMKKFIFGEE